MMTYHVVYMAENAVGSCTGTSTVTTRLPIKTADDVRMVADLIKKEIKSPKVLVLSWKELEGQPTEKQRTGGKTINKEYPKYEAGEPVIYTNGDKIELGIVKKACGGDEYFVNYHTGDTAARTHARHLSKISNRYAYRIVRLDPDGNERRGEKK